MNDTQFADLVSPRRRAGHWSDKPAVDPRVSRPEQDDQMPDHDSVAVPMWVVMVLLVSTPLIVIGGISLFASLLSR
jgi:hypothetical protein